MRNSRLQVGLALIAAITGSGFARGEADKQRVDFPTQVLPILASRCFECHGPDEATREAELRLDTKAGAFATRPDGVVVVKPGDPAGSELFARITSRDDRRMPPDGSLAVTKRQIDLIKQWIAQGAEWKSHWSLIPPQRPNLPRVVSHEGVRNPIDLFIREALRRQGLSPAPEADKRTLIRRVTLALTGLPPSPEEVEAFVADPSQDAYERVVDRLLASSRYGERMAVPWLDAARYADTHGYLFDTQREMWRWRDWVIDAFNRNQPFDEFTIEQLAGDLLPNPTDAQQLATGFNRNHLINNEAGAIPAEYLVENVVDRVNTTATVWMGLSLACCQCHDHKYDPFTQREYYQLYAFFNTVPELGLDGLNSNAKPVMKAPTSLDQDELAELRQRASAAAAQMKSLSTDIEQRQAEWEASCESKTEPPIDGLTAHWPLDESPEDAVGAEATTVFEAAPASYGEGLLGKAALVEGLGYLNAGDRFNFAASDSFSISAWVRPSTKMGRLGIISRMANAKKLFRGYTLQTFVGVPSFFLVHRFPDNMIQVQAKEALEPDRWTHLAVTYDGSGKAAGTKLYVNGELQKPAVVVDKLTEPITTDSPFWIGNGHPGAKYKGRIDDVRVYGRVLSADDVKQLPGLAIESLLAIPREQRNDDQSKRVRRYYLTNHAPAKWRQSYESMLALKEKVVQRERNVPTVMVMKEADKPRKTHMLIRGAYDKRGDEVSAATPAVLPPFDEELPKNRLGLARWLVDARHPLTARVTVNRFWQMHFGRGLVATAEDFGVQGEPPSHPELLDWLACEFIDSGWNVKALQRLIVTSATFRQSSRVTPELQSADPNNRMLARGPRHRLSAEMIRDQALALGGLLSSKIGGPSVRPYQPPGLWREVAFDFSGANLTAQIYQQDSGENLYRRSLYTFWKRTAPPPTMLIFDAPDRERCVVQREQTSTPLQALVLMNDPTYIEASRKLAERVMTDVDSGVRQRISYGFCLATSRPPTNAEMGALVGLYKSQYDRFVGASKLADQLLAIGESKPRAGLDPCELAAFTTVSQVILSLDETIAPK